jgi:GNAT superfamily N-acetyltransferase
MKTVSTKVTYLEMRAPPNHGTPPPSNSWRVVRAGRPTIAFYRFLYNTVGEAWNWVDRRLMTDEQLAEVIHDDLVEVHVLYAEGTPAGYAELDRRRPDEVELAYFGVMPEFLGRGLGRYLLHWAIERAWSYAPRRVWVHTCDLDHEAALPLYAKAGFRVYDEKTIDQVVGE